METPIVGCQSVPKITPPTSESTESSSSEDSSCDSEEKIDTHILPSASLRFPRFKKDSNANEDAPACRCPFCSTRKRFLRHNTALASHTEEEKMFGLKIAISLLADSLDANEACERMKALYAGVTLGIKEDRDRLSESYVHHAASLALLYYDFRKGLTLFAEESSEWRERAGVRCTTESPPEEWSKELNGYLKCEK